MPLAKNPYICNCYTALFVGISRFQGFFLFHPVHQHTLHRFNNLSHFLLRALLQGLLWCAVIFQPPSQPFRISHRPPQRLMKPCPPQLVTDREYPAVLRILKIRPSQAFIIAKVIRHFPDFVIV